MLTRATHIAGFRLAVALVVVVLVAPAADASPIIFTDRAAFATAVQPNAFVAFDTVELDFWGDLPFRSYCGGPVAGECKATIDGILRIDSSDAAFVPDPFGGNLELREGPGAFLSLAGGSQFTAIGFDIATTAQAMFVFDSYSFYSPNGFLGLLFPTPVSGIVLAGRPVMLSDPFVDSVTVDNIAIKAVPEPATILLCCGAIVLLLQRGWLSTRGAGTT